MGHTEKKVALLHYWLTNMRGGENVLEEFCRLYPEAEIFTHAHNPQMISEVINARKIHTSFVMKLPRAKVDCQKYLPLMPAAVKALDLGAYDLIISSESGPIKGIRKPAGATHICYCHTPMRYIWDMYEDYYRNTGVTGKAAMRLFAPFLRKYDLKSAESVDHFIANSHFVAERIKRIYGRESTVIYPPVDTDFFAAGQFQKRNYLLFVGQLIPYKRPDLALEACRKLNCPLMIVGDGPLRKELEKQAGDADVTFTGKLNGERLRKAYAEARALIFPGTEDFGIVPVEAQAAGTPVIAFGRGGALETVIPGKTGVFFNEDSVESLVDAIEEFTGLCFDCAALTSNAATFNAERFRNEVRSFVSQKIKQSGHSDTYR